MILDHRGTRIEGPQDRVLFLLGMVLDQELRAAGMDVLLADEVANRIVVRWQSRLLLEEMVVRQLEDR